MAYKPLHGVVVPCESPELEPEEEKPLPVLGQAANSQDRFRPVIDLENMQFAKEELTPENANINARVVRKVRPLEVGRIVGRGWDNNVLNLWVIFNYKPAFVYGVDELLLVKEQS